jgi:hypothetical protein
MRNLTWLGFGQLFRAWLPIPLVAHYLQLLWKGSCCVRICIDGWHELLSVPKLVLGNWYSILQTLSFCILGVVTGGVHRRPKSTRYHKTWGGCPTTIFSLELWGNTREHSALCAVPAEDYTASSFHDQNPWKCHAPAPAVLGQCLPFKGSIGLVVGNLLCYDFINPS